MEKLEIGEHKLNEMGELNMKKKKWNKLDKSKRLLYSPVVFKHDCSLETYLELWKTKAIPKRSYFSKNFKIILICIWILKNDYRFFYYNLALVIYRVLLFFCWPIMIQWYWVLSCFSHVRLSATPWTVAHQAPLSMGFSRQEYWSGFPSPSPIKWVIVT